MVFAAVDDNFALFVIIILNNPALQSYESKKYYWDNYYYINCRGGYSCFLLFLGQTITPLVIHI